MKLLFLCAATALATQDTTPPVMSLSLVTHNGKTHTGVTDHKLNTAFDAASHGSARNQGYIRNKNSVTCEVGNTAQDVALCPQPTCRYYDHHDHHMKWNGAKYVQVASAAESACKETYYLINVDSNALANKKTYSSIHRNLRSEWLIEFNAEDLSGNAANTLTFTMVFRDTMAPELTTEFGTSYLWKATNHVDKKEFDRNTRSFCKSCTECAASATTSKIATADGCHGSVGGVRPCVHYLARDQDSATDKYDGNVRQYTEVQIEYQGTETLARTTLAGISKEDLFIDTHKLGNWKVTYYARDNARAFGYNGASNAGRQVVTLKVSDKTKPYITLNAHAANPADYEYVKCTANADQLDQECVVECDTNDTASTCGRYQEAGAQCHDRRESWIGQNAAGKGGSWQDEDATVTDTSATMCFDSRTIYNKDHKNVHVVKYDCDDGVNNHADRVTRTITVKDRRAPTITLHGDRAIQTSAGENHAHYIQNSAGTFRGHKDANGNSLASKFEHTDLLDLAMLKGNQGATCDDACEPTAKVNAQITAVMYHGKHCGKDGKLPIKATGSPDGAVDNWKLGNWEYVAGDYSILYTCHDGTGTIKKKQTEFQNSNERPSLTSSKCRYVDNVDHTRPIIQILGSDEMTLEATHTGNYVDDGATCSDQVDGVISQNVEVSGDVVNLSKVGTYTVTYNCKDAAGNAAVPLDRTVVVRQTSCPRCSFNGATSLIHEASFSYVDAGAECSDEVDGVVRTLVSNPVDVERTGTYYVTYRACNSVGLCNDGKSTDGKSHTCLNTNVVYKRQVTIEDTLKPVLSVSYKEQGQWKQVAAGLGKDFAAPTGLYVHGTDTSNPADKWAKAISPRSSKFTHFMAESTASTGAWVWAAAASAIAGLALLAHGQRRTAITTVPV